MTISEFKQDLDVHLNFFLHEKMSKFKAKDRIFQDAMKQAQKIAINGGKRIRPYLIYLAYNINQKNHSNLINSQILNLCLSMEIFHLFCLIHDDIMDRDEKRHSEFTIQNFLIRKHKIDVQTANSVAILIGDLYFAYAQELISKYSIETQEIYHQMIEDVVYGQFLDIYLEKQKKCNKEKIKEKTILKTATYSFQYPIQLGLSVKNSTQEKYNFAHKFGTLVGYAYQIQDDYMSIFNSSAETGKKELMDIKNGQATIFSDQVFKTKYSNEFKKFWGKNFNQNTYKQIRKIISDSGSAESGKKIIHKNIEQAQKLIQQENFENLSDWCLLLEKIQNRIK